MHALADTMASKVANTAVMRACLAARPEGVRVYLRSNYKQPSSPELQLGSQRKRASEPMCVRLARVGSEGHACVGEPWAAVARGRATDGGMLTLGAPTLLAEAAA